VLFDLLKPHIQPLRFIVAFGSEEMRSCLEPMLASIKDDTWDYAVTMGTAAVLEIPRIERRLFIVAEYGQPSLDLDLVAVVKRFKLPLLLISNGREPLSDQALQSTAVYGYQINPTPEELYVGIQAVYWMALATKKLLRLAQPDHLLP